MGSILTPHIVLQTNACPNAQTETQAALTLLTSPSNIRVRLPVAGKTRSDDTRENQTHDKLGKLSTQQSKGEGSLTGSHIPGNKRPSK